MFKKDIIIFELSNPFLLGSWRVRIHRCLLRLPAPLSLERQTTRRTKWQHQIILGWSGWHGTSQEGHGGDHCLARKGDRQTMTKKHAHISELPSNIYLCVCTYISVPRSVFAMPATPSLWPALVWGPWHWEDSHCWDCGQRNKPQLHRHQGSNQMEQTKF